MGRAMAINNINFYMDTYKNHDKNVMTKYPNDPAVTTHDNVDQK
jgi:predicted 3-demethylubiquinone-9 3-methyltransferase (glyoxalase superfamily)